MVILQSIYRYHGGRELIASVKRAMAAGWTIVSGEPFVDEDEDGKRCCCALHTLDLTAGDFQEAASIGLEWPFARAWAFAQGFDGEHRRLKNDFEEGVSVLDASHHRAFRLGRLVRRWLKKTTGREVQPA